MLTSNISGRIDGAVVLQGKLTGAIVLVENMDLLYLVRIDIVTIDLDE
jgi:hypothetical protein